MKIANYANPNNEEQENIKNEFLEHLIWSNPQGIMSVLNRSGYTGSLAPQNQEELYEAAQYYIDRGGESAVVELCKIAPEFEAMRSIEVEQTHKLEVPDLNLDEKMNELVGKFKALSNTTKIMIGLAAIFILFTE